MNLPRAQGLAEAAVAVVRGLLPPGCPACAEPLDLPGSPLCRRCRADLASEPMVDLRRCAICDARMENGGTKSLCRRCEHGRPAFGKLRGAVRYNAQARALVHELKFERRTARAPFMAGFMAARFHRAWADDFLFDALVPTPLHPRRRWRRGFNQSELLADHLGELLGKPAEASLLIRAKATSQQALLTPEERAENVAEAFVVPDPSRAAGRSFLLLDDVATSGATLLACALALRQAGAARVDCLVFARA